MHGFYWFFTINKYKTYYLLCNYKSINKNLTNTHVKHYFSIRINSFLLKKAKYSNIKKYTEELNNQEFLLVKKLSENKNPIKINSSSGILIYTSHIQKLSNCLSISNILFSLHLASSRISTLHSSQPEFSLSITPVIRSSTLR